MRSDQSGERARARQSRTMTLTLGLIALATVFVALPQMFSTHAGTGPKPPQGLLIVVTTTDDHDDGLCDVDCTLREALNAANTAATADTIVFKVTGQINLASALPDIIDSVTLDGPGADLLTVRRSDSAGAFRIFTVGASGLTVNFISLTIANGSDSNGGGGILGRGTVNVTKCTISGNAAFVGGGIYHTGLLNVVNSTVSDNRASEGGGGITSLIATGNVINSTVSGNSAVFGGGLYNIAGNMSVTNSTVSGNSAEALGGGIVNNGNTVFVKSSIVALNTAEVGGVLLEGQDVWGNFDSAGFNLIGKKDHSVGFTAPTDLTGTVAAPLDPKLETDGMGKPVLKDNGGQTETVALLCGSPAIDKGTSNGLTGALTTDQRGADFARTLDDPVTANAAGGDGTDIGAFELPVCNHPSVAQCKNIQVSAGAACQASITASDVDNGSFDPDAGDSIANRSLDNAGPFTLGPHTVTLTVTDTHGASSSCMATVTVVDTTPPQITCPATVIAKAQPGSTCVVVDYAPPQASDNCTVMTVACTPPASSCFPLGTTTVDCTATDTSGNTAACSFVVTTFDVCLQDDSNPATVFLGNSATGDYRFCFGGTIFSGRATVTRHGSLFRFEHNEADRRVMAKDDEGVFRGTASLQSPPGRTRCTIADRDTRNNSCLCQ